MKTLLKLIFIPIIILVILGLSSWYGVQKFSESDKAIHWLYQDHIRPHLLGELPSHFSHQQKEQALQRSDKIFEYYSQLPSKKRSAMVNEAIIASYYYTKQEVAPPEKIPNLLEFMKMLRKND